MSKNPQDPPVKVYLGPILILGGLHHLPARLQGLRSKLCRPDGSPCRSGDSEVLQWRNQGGGVKGVS